MQICLHLSWDKRSEFNMPIRKDHSDDSILLTVLSWRGFQHTLNHPFSICNSRASWRVIISTSFNWGTLSGDFLWNKSIFALRFRFWWIVVQFFKTNQLYIKHIHVFLEGIHFLGQTSCLKQVLVSAALAVAAVLILHKPFLGSIYNKNLYLSPREPWRELLGFGEFFNQLSQSSHLKFIFCALM